MKNFSKGRREDKKMYRATCAECGRSCEVPFKPSNDKPVYCSSCFGRGSSDKPAPSKPDQSSKKFDAINEKLDQILFLLKNCNSGKESTKETIKETSGIKLKKLGAAKEKADR